MIEAQPAPPSNPDEDGFLYHYTDLNALIGIVTNKVMWATHIRHLNDTSEQEILRDALRVRLGEMLLPEEDRRDWQKILDAPLLPCFVICFSEDRGDRLSQWRAYGGSSGVCLRFDKKMLRKYCGTKGTTAMLTNVNYVNPKGDAVLDARLRLISAPRYGALDFLSVIGSTIKHSAFKEESEWRVLIVEWALVEMENKIQHRVRSSMLVPYIEWNFAGALRDLLTEVIVGPIAHKEQTRDAIKRLLKENGFSPATQVCCSDTPYREF